MPPLCPPPTASKDACSRAQARVRAAVSSRASMLAATGSTTARGRPCSVPMTICPPADAAKKVTPTERPWHMHHSPLACSTSSKNSKKDSSMDRMDRIYDDMDGQDG
eukprot:1035140-Pelagomonas_calceolata.AAC.2